MNFKNKFLVITIFLTGVGFLSQFLLGGIFSFFQSVFELILISLVFTLLVRLFRKKNYTFPIQFLRSYLIFGSITGVLAMTLWIGALFSNTFPGALSKVVLSNGEKTIVFYQMSHIATESYYKNISREIGEYGNEGYTVFIEGVQPGKKENHERLEKAIGMKISSGTYTEIADLIGLKAQDEHLYDMLPETQIIHADLSVDDIASFLSTGSLRSGEPLDVTEELRVITRSNLSHSALSYLVRGIMNASLRYSLSEDSLSDIFDPETTNILLSKRNSIVVDAYEASHKEKVIFLYGALHFQGMYDLLKVKDPRWEIRSHEAIYPYVP